MKDVKTLIVVNTTNSCQSLDEPVRVAAAGIAKFAQDHNISVALVLPLSRLSDQEYRTQHGPPRYRHPLPSDDEIAHHHSRLRAHCSTCGFMCVDPSVLLSAHNQPGAFTDLRCLHITDLTLAFYVRSLLDSVFPLQPLKIQLKLADGYANITDVIPSAPAPAVSHTNITPSISNNITSNPVDPASIDPASATSPSQQSNNDLDQTDNMDMSEDMKIYEAKFSPSGDLSRFRLGMTHLLLVYDDASQYSSYCNPFVLTRYESPTHYFGVPLATICRAFVSCMEEARVPCGSIHQSVAVLQREPHLILQTLEQYSHPCQFRPYELHRFLHVHLPAALNESIINNQVEKELATLLGVKPSTDHQQFVYLSEHPDDYWSAEAKWQNVPAFDALQPYVNFSGGNALNSVLRSLRQLRQTNATPDDTDHVKATKPLLRSIFLVSGIVSASVKSIGAGGVVVVGLDCEKALERALELIREKRRDPIKSSHFHHIVIILDRYDLTKLPGPVNKIFQLIDQLLSEIPIEQLQNGTTNISILRPPASGFATEDDLLRLDQELQTHSSEPSRKDRWNYYSLRPFEYETDDDVHLTIGEIACSEPAHYVSSGLNGDHAILTGRAVHLFSTILVQTFADSSIENYPFFTHNAAESSLKIATRPYVNVGKIRLDLQESLSFGSRDIDMRPDSHTNTQHSTKNSTSKNFQQQPPPNNPKLAPSSRLAPSSPSTRRPTQAIPSLLAGISLSPPPRRRHTPYSYRHRTPVDRSRR